MTTHLPTPPGILALRRAKEILHKQSVLAEIVGVTQPSVAYMLRSGKRVPAEWCLPIEQATKGAVTSHDLRPDLYPVKETHK